jgi:ribonuclease HI
MGNTPFVLRIVVLLARRHRRLAIVPSKCLVDGYNLERSKITKIADIITCRLRAAVAALQFRIWGGAGHKRLIIATDSEYVVKGVTTWIRGWSNNGWVTSQGSPVKNRDLWEMLLLLVRKHKEKTGTDVLFWRIPRGLNTQADAAAKGAAEMPETSEYRKYSGMLTKPTEMSVFHGPWRVGDETNPAL